MPAPARKTQNHVTPETHGSAFEVQTGVSRPSQSRWTSSSVCGSSSKRTLDTLGLRAAGSGTHPFAIWQEIAVSAGERYQFVQGSMRELARREPTFALHVHVGLPDPETAIQVHNRMRVHLPLLLALSANSPFWQGRDTGLASARTPLFQAFPRVGSPPFPQLRQYARGRPADPDRSGAGIELSLVGRAAAAGARHGRDPIDGRPDPRKTRRHWSHWSSPSSSSKPRSATDRTAIDAQEAISENRFLAARDGVHASLIDADLEIRIRCPRSWRTWFPLRPHAQDLGCDDELLSVNDLYLRSTGQAPDRDRQAGPLVRPPRRATFRSLRREARRLAGLWLSAKSQPDPRVV